MPSVRTWWCGDPDDAAVRPGQPAPTWSSSRRSRRRGSTRSSASRLTAPSGTSWPPGSRPGPSEFVAQEQVAVVDHAGAARTTAACRAAAVRRRGRTSRADGGDALRRHARRADPRHRRRPTRSSSRCRRAAGARTPGCWPTARSATSRLLPAARPAARAEPRRRRPAEPRGRRPVLARPVRPAGRGGRPAGPVRSSAG